MKRTQTLKIMIMLIGMLPSAFIYSQDFDNHNSDIIQLNVNDSHADSGLKMQGDNSFWIMVHDWDGDDLEFKYKHSTHNSDQGSWNSNGRFRMTNSGDFFAIRDLIAGEDIKADRDIRAERHLIADNDVRAEGNLVSKNEIIMEKSGGKIQSKEGEAYINFFDDNLSNNGSIGLKGAINLHNSYFYNSTNTNSGHVWVNDIFRVQIGSAEQIFYAGANHIELNRKITHKSPTQPLLFEHDEIHLLQDNAHGIKIDNEFTRIVGNKKFRVENDLVTNGGLATIGGVSQDNQYLAINDGDGLKVIEDFLVEGATSTLSSPSIRLNGNISNEEANMPVRLDDENGVSIPQGILYVANKIKTKDLDVAPNETVWPDYVFEDNYALKSLEEVKEFINEEGHLPGVPSASTIQSEGYNLPEMNALLMKKIEELTLYILELKQENKAQSERIEALEQH